MSDNRRDNYGPPTPEQWQEVQHVVSDENGDRRESECTPAAPCSEDDCWHGRHQDGSLPDDRRDSDLEPDIQSVETARRKRFSAAITEARRNLDGLETHSDDLANAAMAVADAELTATQEGWLQATRNIRAEIARLRSSLARMATTISMGGDPDDIVNAIQSNLNGDNDG